MDRRQRAIGAVVGSAVGDALGAPFEFGLAGEFTGRFPRSGGDGDMCAGGGWDRGEATDDTQMALHVAQSLLDHNGLDLPDIFARFQRWTSDNPKDIGIQTETVLIRVALAAADPLDAIDDTLSEVDSLQRDRYAIVLAVYGDTAIPAGWTKPLHVPLPGTNQTLRHNDLVELAQRLAA